MTTEGYGDFLWCNMSTNITPLHLAAAKDFVKELKMYKEVVGVVLLGSASRGYADIFSDIDIVVFVDNPPFDKVKKGGQLRGNFEFDIIVSDYEFARNHKWSMDQRWAYSSAKVLYDPHSKVRQLIRDKTRLMTTERTQLLVDNIMLIGWYGVAPVEEGTWHGYTFWRPPDFWIRRGNPQSAHYILDRVLDMFLDTLFLTNHSLIPDEKWKLNLSYSLPWLPPNYSRHLEGILLRRTLDEEEFGRRLQSFYMLYRPTIAQLESLRLLPKNIYRYLLRNSEYYNTV